MGIDLIWQELIKQSPGLAATIAIVVLFLKSQERRDKAWQSELREITKALEDNTRVITEHDAAMRVTAKHLEKNATKPRKK